MVNARLHIICGNCGCNDMFEYRIDPSDFTEDYDDDVDIVCKNCSTIHSLNDNAEDKTETTLRADLAAARAKADRMENERNNWEETANLYARNSAYHEEGRAEARAKAKDMARRLKCVEELFDHGHEPRAQQMVRHLYKTAADVLKEWG